MEVSDDGTGIQKVEGIEVFAVPAKAVVSTWVTLCCAPGILGGELHGLCFGMAAQSAQALSLLWDGVLIVFV